MQGDPTSSAPGGPSFSDQGLCWAPCVWPGVPDLTRAEGAWRGKWLPLGPAAGHPGAFPGLSASRASPRGSGTAGLLLWFPNPGPPASSPALCGSLGPVVGGMRGFTLGRAGSRVCGSQSPFQTLECPSLDVLALRGPREPAPVLGGSLWSWALLWEDGPSGDEGPGGPLWGRWAHGCRGSHGAPRWPPCPE